LGLILDSSVVIAAERLGLSAREMVKRISEEADDDEIGLSVLTLAEVAHGVVRANSPERVARRQRFLDAIAAYVPIYAVTAKVAIRAGRVDGMLQAAGTRIPLAEVLIGATALEIDYAVATRNVRDFQRIPGLRVVPL
jgi:predicted nucleic acid-binding protein